MCALITIYVLQMDKWTRKKRENKVIVGSCGGHKQSWEHFNGLEKVEQKISRIWLCFGWGRIKFFEEIFKLQRLKLMEILKALIF